MIRSTSTNKGKTIKGLISSQDGQRYAYDNVGGNFEYWVFLNTLLQSLLQDWRPKTYSWSW